jgi:endonuclease/exonuclease/phosphatase family metal-dependent hydrolase
MLVRTWNLFHGNTVPPGRWAHLEEMVRLASADRPDVLCLQEVPAWALPKLGDWARMPAFTEVAARPKLGPLPSTAEVGRRITELNHGFFRSAFTGQGNAILLNPGFEPMDYHALVLNPRDFRRREAARLGLGLVERLAWAKERRVCQTIRPVLPDGRRLLVANLHATAYAPDRRLADAELRRAGEFVLALALPGEVDVIAGDFNVFPSQSETLKHLVEEGFSDAGPEVDHVLVRGAAVSSRDRRQRRNEEGLLLSDHPPLDVRVE